MDYSQFLNMIPEATLMLALIIVFCADFALHKSPRKTYVLSILTGALLLCQMVPCFMAEPAEAFGGLYVTSPMVNVMKTILTRWYVHRCGDVAVMAEDSTASMQASSICWSSPRSWVCI